MMTKILVAATLGLLLIAGPSQAERHKSISPRTGPNEDAPRESMVEDTNRGSSKGNRSGGNRESEISYLEPVHLTGTLRASRGRGLSIDGQTLLIGSNCGFFPVSDPERLPSISSWNGRKVAVFGYRTRAGIDVRLLILQDNSRGGGRSHDPSMIPSANDPTVGVQRHGTPG